MQPLFQQRQAYPGSHFPFDLTGAAYEPGCCPVAEQILDTAVRLPVSEFYTNADVEEVIQGVRKVASYYRL